MMTSCQPAFMKLTAVCVGQGAVQGPEEFAEGFVIGVRSLLGHTVGKKQELIKPPT